MKESLLLYNLKLNFFPPV